VSIHRHRPEGSPRNTWATTVERVDLVGDRARVQTGDPLPLIAEITTTAASELSVRPGAAVWVAVKATEIDVETEEPRPWAQPG
jgi:molybdate transport system ATP-binding protein